MNVGTLLRFLIGNRQAILDVAASKHGLWLGLLFVLSAGLAREYDGADLLHEPWHLAIPLGASLGSSLALFLLVELTVWFGSGWRTGIVARYLAFLKVFWMTAPLAWLYAIPVEQFLSPADAVRANLTFLAIVAAWRVLLISRVVSVLYQFPIWAALPIVMLYADTIVLVILCLTPLPIFDVMGGIRHTEDEVVIGNVACSVRVFGVLSWPLWLIGTVILWARFRWTNSELAENRPGHMGWSMWALAALSLVIFCAALPFTQPVQQNRWRVEHYLRSGDIADGIQYLAARRRQDFPPHWDVPPRIGYGERVPDLMEAIESALEADAPAWVRQLFVDKIMVQTGHGDGYWGEEATGILRIREMNAAELREATAILARIPEGPAIAQSRKKRASGLLEYEKDLDPELRRQLEEFVRLADQAKGVSDE